MRLQIVYIDGCPNWQVAYARLREALQSLGAHIEVERVEIRTTTDADVWRFHGSPSLLMNGHDPFASPSAPVGLACRLYTTPAGLAGSPTVGQLIDVLAQVIAERGRTSELDMP